MRIRCFQHVVFEGLGAIEPWLRSRGHHLTYTEFFRNEPVPSIDSFDGLIVMGGPMGANDDGDLPWLTAEKQLIAEAITRGMPVLGICLGAQLMAAALGARVYKNPQKEIGWFEISRTASAENHAFGSVFPSKATVFHWHGDTFDLPRNATHLAQSTACKNQAFCFGTRALALQFHLEMTPASVQSIVTHCEPELVPASQIQTKSQILENRLHFEANNQLMEGLLAKLF